MDVGAGAHPAPWHPAGFSWAWYCKNPKERNKNQKEKGLVGFSPIVTARLTLSTAFTSLFVSSLIFHGVPDLAELKCWVSLFKKKKSWFYSRHDQGSLKICLFQCHTCLWLCLSSSCCGEAALEWGWIWESKGMGMGMGIGILLFCWPFLKISNSHI